MVCSPGSALRPASTDGRGVESLDSSACDDGVCRDGPSGGAGSGLHVAHQLILLRKR